MYMFIHVCTRRHSRRTRTSCRARATPSRTPQVQPRVEKHWFNLRILVYQVIYDSGPSHLCFITLKPRVQWYTESMSLEYEPTSELLHISVKVQPYVGNSFPDISGPASETDFFVDNLLVRIHYVVVTIRRTGLAPWELNFLFQVALHLPSYTWQVQPYVEKHSFESPLFYLSGGLCGTLKLCRG